LNHILLPRHRQFVIILDSFIFLGLVIRCLVINFLNYDTNSTICLSMKERNYGIYCWCMHVYHKTQASLMRLISLMWPLSRWHAAAFNSNIYIIIIRLFICCLDYSFYESTYLTHELYCTVVLYMANAFNTSMTTLSSYGSSFIYPPNGEFCGSF
jgi:hypothetical protein